MKICGIYGNNYTYVILKIYILTFEPKLCD